MQEILLSHRPQVLNGYRVVLYEQHSGCATVLVDKGDEWVVATWWPELGETWCWGHYVDSLLPALNEFRAVCARNERRS